MFSTARLAPRKQSFAGWKNCALECKTLCFSCGRDWLFVFLVLRVVICSDCFLLCFFVLFLRS